jgi:hypothetical protein
MIMARSLGTGRLAGFAEHPSLFLYRSDAFKKSRRRPNNPRRGLSLLFARKSQTFLL